MNDKDINVNKVILHHEEGIDLIPSNLDLSALAVSLVNAMSREYTMRYCLKEIDRFCKERLKVELNSKTQIGKVKNGIDFLGFRLILIETGKVIKKLRGSSKRRIKKHLRNLKKLEDKGIVDREYVNIRKNCFYSRINNSDESRTFLNKAKLDY